MILFIIAVRYATNTYVPYLLLYWKFAKCLAHKNKWSTERSEIEKNLNIWRYLVPHYNYKLDLKNNVSLSKSERKF